MVEHTKEPWEIWADEEFGDAIVDSAGFTIADCSGGRTIEQDEANARRIVACVNAMQGIPDPAAYVVAFEGMRRALVRLQYWFDTDPEILEAMTPDERADNARQLANIRAALTAARAAKGEAE